MGKATMIYKRKYLQFNDLVLDGYDMIRDADHGSFTPKVSGESYTYRHGEYTPFKSDYLLSEPQQVTMILALQLKKIPCEMREYYVDFATQELSKPGKLWAIQNNSLVWAYAYVSNKNPLSGKEKYLVEYDVEFTLYEGVWHKADSHKTFLQDYDPCYFLLCEGYQTKKPCSAGNCCTDCYTINDVRGDCCDCDNVTKEMSLCYMKENLQDLYKACSGNHIVYNCQKGQEIFGDKYLGSKLCTDDTCDTTIAGLVHSDTDIPADGVTVHLTGNITDARVTINDNTNIIKGEYEGTITITPSGDVIHSTDCCDTVLDPSVLVIPDGNDYGWQVHKGNNRFIVNSCCGLVCAYVEVDALTM